MTIEEMQELEDEKLRKEAEETERRLAEIEEERKASESQNLGENTTGNGGNNGTDTTTDAATETAKPITEQQKPIVVSPKHKLNEQLAHFRISKQPSEEAEKATQSNGKTEGEKPKDTTKANGNENQTAEEKEKENKQLVQAGAESAANLIDHVFAKTNKYLNKSQTLQPYKADADNRKLLEKSVNDYFQSFNVKFNPKKGLIYTIIVIYGFDFFTGLIIKFQDLLEWFSARRKKKAQTAYNKFTQQNETRYNNTQHHTRQNGEEEEFQKPNQTMPPKNTVADNDVNHAPKSKEETELDRIMSLPDHKRTGYKPCGYSLCDKYNGKTKWIPEKKVYCCNECKGNGLKEKNPQFGKKKETKPVEE